MKNDKMKVSQLYIYPIKSLQGIAVDQAIAQNDGFQHDRRFMLIKHEQQNGLPHRNMHLTHFPEMMLFSTALSFSPGEPNSGAIDVFFNPPDAGAPRRSLSIPLRPDAGSLSPVKVELWRSGTQAYDMGDEYNSWFSSCFGYSVSLIYLGSHRRTILSSVSGNTRQSSNKGWLSSLAQNIPGSSLLGYGAIDEKPNITFTDCAPLLVTTEESLADVSARLDGVDAQMVKFRPNIVVSGASGAWVEDFWNEIAVGDGGKGSLRISLPHNCARCASLNIDYKTGRPAEGEEGKVLKYLQKDRRVDKGMKYNPVFGRYGFVAAGAGTALRIGDEVEVVGVNEKRTVFDWPGLATATT